MANDTEALLKSYPQYEEFAKLDEYVNLQKYVYLDYAGAGLAAKRQYEAHSARLASTAFGNPHSTSPTSKAATDLVEETRKRILSSLNASEEDYMVIFTANATGAARLVGEGYQFKRNGKLVMTADNHNSVNGLREFARHAKSQVRYIHSENRDLPVDTAVVEEALRCKTSLLTRLRASSCFPLPNLSHKKPLRRKGLFAFPAQSNFSGVRHPLSWVSLAQGHGYDVLLDAAAYLPTAELDLSERKPEFVIMSWYKVFGYPTGLGCLVARRDAVARLIRPWFSGGTVQAASVGTPWHIKESGEAAFEDGTVNFLSIPDIIEGLNWIKEIGGIPAIGERVRCLTKVFLFRLRSLHHSNNRPMAIIYGPENMKSRGGTVCFNFIDANGCVVDDRHVASESAAANISLRTGCFCNPGAGEDAFLGGKKTPETPLRRFRAKATSIDEYIALMGLPSAGAIRVSFGLASRATDVDQFFEFAEKYKDKVIKAANYGRRQQC